MSATRHFTIVAGTLTGNRAMVARIAAELPKVEANARQQFDRLFRDLDGTQESRGEQDAVETVMAGAPG